MIKASSGKHFLEACACAKFASFKRQLHILMEGTYAHIMSTCCPSQHNILRAKFHELLTPNLHIRMLILKIAYAPQSGY